MRKQAFMTSTDRAPMCEGMVDYIRALGMVPTHTDLV